MERPPGIQQTQLDVPGTDLREIASQALEAMKQAKREEDERAKIARHGGGKSPTNKSLAQNLTNAGINMRATLAQFQGFTMSLVACLLKALIAWFLDWLCRRLCLSNCPI